MTTIAEAAYEKLQNLPIELQKQVLDFIEFIGKKEKISHSTVNHKSKDDQREFGRLKGQLTYPDDINWGDAEIQEMFETSIK